MDWLKIGGGVAAGIGTMTLLPGGRGVGKISVPGALIGGTLGGIAGAFVALFDEEERDRLSCRRSSVEDSEVEVEVGEVDPDPLVGRLLEIREALANEEAYSRLALALFAYGAAWSALDFASDDAIVHRVKLHEIAASAQLPAEALEKIGEFMVSPPSIGDAMEFVLELDGSAKVLFRELMPRVVGNGQTMEKAI